MSVCFFYKHNNKNRLILENFLQGEELKFAKDVFKFIKITTNTREIYKYLYNNINLNISEIYIIQERDILHLSSIYFPSKRNIEININEKQKIVDLILKFESYNVYTEEILNKYNIPTINRRYKIFLFDLTKEFSTIKTYVKIIKIQNEEDISTILYKVDFMNLYKRFYIILDNNFVIIKHINNNKNNYIKLANTDIIKILNTINKCPRDYSLQDLKEYMELPYNTDSD